MNKRIHFRIEYTDKDGNLVESMSSTNDRAVLHALLDEYLDKNTDWSNDQYEGIGFHIGSECTCHNEAK